MLRKPLLIRLWVVVLVLFCGVFLGVAETIVGWPVCFYVGIVLWSVSWCCGNHCWLACLLLCGYGSVSSDSPCIPSRMMRALSFSLLSRTKLIGINPGQLPTRK